MAISAELVKELRERTGAGMMECKKALVAANGDIEAAIEAMRKAGTAKAAKKASRVTAEGRIDVKVSIDGQRAAMVEVNCETDFVARDINFVDFTALVVNRALMTDCTDVQRLAELTVAEGADQTIEQARQELINKVGENIQIRRVVLLRSTGTLGSYVHGGRIGALVALSVANAELAKDLALHVAASNPLTIKPGDVPAELIAKEKEIFLAQSVDSGKPADIIEKMINGRINKFLSEITLLGQPFVKEPSQSVGSLLTAAHAEVTAFARFEVGEGIEKQVEDFAEAVRAQVSGDH